MKLVGGSKKTSVVPVERRPSKFVLESGEGANKLAAFSVIQISNAELGNHLTL